MANDPKLASMFIDISRDEVIAVAKRYFEQRHVKLVIQPATYEAMEKLGWAEQVKPYILIG